MKYRTPADPFYGVYYGQAALPHAPERLFYLDNAVIRGLQVYNVETSSDIPVYDLGAAAGRDPYEMFLGGARSIIKITNPNAAQERRLIIFRDSFGSSIAPLLAAGYSEITLVDIRYISPFCSRKARLTLRKQTMRCSFTPHRS